MYIKWGDQHVSTFICNAISIIYKLYLKKHNKKFWSHVLDFMKIHGPTLPSVLL